jgi:hypothetical protein
MTEVWSEQRVKRRERDNVRKERILDYDVTMFSELRKPHMPNGRTVQGYQKAAEASE